MNLLKKNFNKPSEEEVFVENADTLTKAIVHTVDKKAAKLDMKGDEVLSGVISAVTQILLRVEECLNRDLTTDQMIDFLRTNISLAKGEKNAEDVPERIETEFGHISIKAEKK